MGCDSKGMSTSKNLKASRASQARRKEKQEKPFLKEVGDKTREALYSVTHLGREKITTLHELFIEQLQDLFSAEEQLIEALPKMAKAAHAPALRQGFETHLKETKEHARRLERLLKSFDEETGGKKCKAMQGLVAEGSEAISEYASPEVKDAALIAAAQRVEHYEIAGYGCVRTYAAIMGHTVAAKLLQTTLDEEAATDKKLNQAADKLNFKPPFHKSEA